MPNNDSSQIPAKMLPDVLVLGDIGLTIMPNIDSSQIPAKVINKAEFESQFDSVEHISIQPGCWFPLGTDKVALYDGNLATTTFAGDTYLCVSASSEAYTFMQNNKSCI